MAGEWEVKLTGIGLYDEATHLNLLAKRWTGDLEGVEVETTVVIPGRNESRTVSELDAACRELVRAALRSLLDVL